MSGLSLSEQLIQLGFSKKESNKPSRFHRAATKQESSSKPTHSHVSNETKKTWRPKSTKPTLAKSLKSESKHSEQPHQEKKQQGKKTEPHRRHHHTSAIVSRNNHTHSKQALPLVVLKNTADKAGAHVERWKNRDRKRYLQRQYWLKNWLSNFAVPSTGDENSLFYIRNHNKVRFVWVSETIIDGLLSGDFVIIEHKRKLFVVSSHNLLPKHEWPKSWVLRYGSVADHKKHA